MNSDGKPLTNDDLVRERTAVQRSLRRVTTSMIAVVVVVMLLASAALVQTWKVQLQTAEVVDATQRAEQSRREQNKSRALHLDEAASLRETGQTYQRVKALGMLATAAKIRPDADLRAEAIGWMGYTAFDEVEGVGFRGSIANIGFGNTVDFVAVAGGENKTIYVRSLKDGKIIYELGGAEGAAGWLHFSPDGHWLTGRNVNGDVALWNTATKKLVRRLPGVSGNFTAHGYDFSPDSRVLALSSSQSNLLFIDLVGDRELDPFFGSNRFHVVRYSPNGKALAITGGPYVYVLDSETHSVLAAYRWGYSPEWVAWHPEGEWLAIIGNNKRITLWHWRDGVIRGFDTAETKLVQACFSSDGSRLITWSGDQTVAEWDLATKKVRATIEGARVDHFSDDGRRIAFVRGSRECGYLQLPERQEYRSFAGLLFPYRGISWIGSDVLAAGSTVGLHVLDANTGAELQTLPVRGVRVVRTLSDKRALLLATTNGFFVSALDSRALPQRAERLTDHHTNVMAALSTDGRWAGLIEGTSLRVVRPESRYKGHLIPEATQANNWRFANDGRWLAGVWTNHWAIWEPKTGKRLVEFDERAFRVGFSPSNHWIAVAAPKRLDLRAAETWRSETTVPQEWHLWPGAIAFSPDESLIAVAASASVIRLFKTRGLELLGDLNCAGMGPVQHLEFNGSGTRLAAATLAGNVHVWDLGLIGKQLAALNLGFDQPMTPATDASRFLSTAAPKTSRGVTFAALAVGGVALAICLCVLALRRYRDLVQNYFQAEALVVRRGEQLAEAQAELVHSQKMRALGTLAAGVAHDFNNLLSVIRMANKLTGEETRDNTDVQENVQLVDKTVTQGKAVVRAMLGYSRKPTERGTYSVVELVERTVKLLHKEFLSGIDLKLEPDPNTPKVEGVPNRLEQILLNLIVNAAEAMEGKGKLLVAVRSSARANHAFMLRPRASAGYVEVLVADSGPGMSPEIRERMFEPFFTTKNVGSTPGTGLGLSMVYTIAREEGFGITVESEPGAGTTVRIFVPVEAFTTTENAVAESPNQGSGGQQIDATNVSRQMAPASTAATLRTIQPQPKR